MSLLIKNATVLSVDPRDRVIEDGAVYVENGRIAALGPSGEVEAAHAAGAGRIIEGRGKVVLPGFISTHNHVGYTFFRGRAEDVGLACATGQYFPMATVASREERLAVGSLTYAELLKSGVTTTLEMEEEADVFAPFVEALGVRSFMGIMTHDVDVDAMTRNEFRYDEALREAQLRQAVDFAERWHGKAGGRIQVMMTPNMTISSSPELLRASREAADRMGLRTSIHLGWGEYEAQVIRRLHDQRPFEYARDAGMLGADTVCAHCYVVGDPDVDVLAASRATVAHCPLMNSVRGHIAPVVEYRSRGIPVSLAIDNMFADHFEVLRAAVTMARIKTGDAVIMQCPEALRLATMGGAEALGMGAEIGSIEPGKRADLQMLDFRRFGLTPVLDPVRNLVYHAHATDVELVMVEGRVLVEDFELKSVDAGALLDAAAVAAGAAWERFVAKYGDVIAR